MLVSYVIKKTEHYRYSFTKNQVKEDLQRMLNETELDMSI